MGKQKTTQSKTQSLYLDKIDRDAGTQIRLKINQEVVEEYAECMKNGDRFPPITVFKCKEGRRVFYTLADGFHRCLAAELNKQKTISCEVLEGEARDALEYALKANSAHGLRRTNKDKRNAVKIALKDEGWASLPSREVARLCAVSDFLVNTIRKELEEKVSARKLQMTRTVTRKGKSGTQTFQMTVNKKKKPQKNKESFEVTLKKSLDTIFSKRIKNKLKEVTHKSGISLESLLNKAIEKHLKSF